MPALCTGTLRHRRFWPKGHRFTYPVFLALLDVDRLPEAMGVSRLLGFNRFAWASYDDRDHLGDPARPLRERLREDAESKGFAFPEGPVELLTNLRFWGYCFNPVSYIYAHDVEGRLALIGAEVTSTPWKERIVYWMRVPLPDTGITEIGREERSRPQVLSPPPPLSLFSKASKKEMNRDKGDEGDGLGMNASVRPVPQSASLRIPPKGLDGKEHRIPIPGDSPRPAAVSAWAFDVSKAMHVSPFMPMDLRYRWTFTLPGEAFKVRMALFLGRELVFDADLDLTARPWEPGEIRRTLLAFPFHSFKVITAIHWEALKLWLKRVPIFTHPAKA